MPGSPPEELSPIPCVIPIQLLAENLARLKGLNPDSPRGLGKSDGNLVIYVSCKRPSHFAPVEEMGLAMCNLRT